VSIKIKKLGGERDISLSSKKEGSNSEFEKGGNVSWRSQGNLYM